ncbi:uncharacterized protein NEMAJ01_1191 [Nematocida major]|uniref:uncharacterized protein n=1 Tax=Nematocida major TaxID=1912982 RepID=UPI00200755CB|nr:uncharacterized protein NEMAJ01_1191 [Nematocida major]KAH9386295.1 hypothetical protein NEMAJ01_1191 [Nematocida major]
MQARNVEAVFKLDQKREKELKKIITRIRIGRGKGKDIWDIVDTIESEEVQEIIMNGLECGRIVNSEGSWDRNMEVIEGDIKAMFVEEMKKELTGEEIKELKKEVEEMKKALEKERQEISKMKNELEKERKALQDEAERASKRNLGIKRCYTCGKLGHTTSVCYYAERTNENEFINKRESSYLCRVDYSREKEKKWGFREREELQEQKKAAAAGMESAGDSEWTLVETKEQARARKASAEASEESRRAGKVMEVIRDMLLKTKDNSQKAPVDKQPMCVEEVPSLLSKACTQEEHEVCEKKTDD